jgi:hypothetical protein
MGYPGFCCTQGKVVFKIQARQHALCCCQSYGSGSSIASLATTQNQISRLIHHVLLSLVIQTKLTLHQEDGSRNSMLSIGHLRHHTLRFLPSQLGNLTYWECPDVNRHNICMPSKLQCSRVEAMIHKVSHVCIIMIYSSGLWR